MKHIKNLNQYLNETRGSHEVDVEEIIDDLNSSLKYASASLKDTKGGQVVAIYLDTDPAKDVKIANNVISQYGGKLKLDKRASADDTLIYQIEEGLIASPNGVQPSQFDLDFVGLQAAQHGMTREEYIAHYASPSIGLGIDESFDSSTPNANDLGRYFIKLLAARDQAHVFHWQTQSFAQHEAFGTFYEDFLDSVDDMVESIMGLKGRPVFGQASILVEDYSDVNINKFFERIYPLFDNELEMICDSEAHEEIFDLARAITANIDKLKYLLTLS